MIDPKTPPEAEKEAPRGFFRRLFDKLDADMKEKADKAAEEGGDCCSDGKCC